MLSVFTIKSDQLNVTTVGERDQPIVRSNGMLTTRNNREAEPRIIFHRRFQIPDDNDDMINPQQHGPTD